MVFDIKQQQQTHTNKVKKILSHTQSNLIARALVFDVPRI